MANCNHFASIFWVWSIQPNILCTTLVKYHFPDLKLLISQSKFISPLEFEIIRVACKCIYYCRLPYSPLSINHNMAFKTPSMMSLRSKIREDHLTCTICFNSFTAPKALPCLHTFCEGCIRDYVSGRGYEAQGQFPCPVCRADIPIPPGGIAAFPVGFMILYWYSD